MKSHGRLLSDSESDSRQLSSKTRTSLRNTRCCLHGKPCSEFNLVPRVKPKRERSRTGSRRSVSTDTDVQYPRYNQEQDVVSEGTQLAVDGWLEERKEWLKKRFAEDKSEKSEITPSSELYIGAKTKEEAEESVIMPTSFHLYHQLCYPFKTCHISSSETASSLITNTIQLYIVYKSSDSVIWHFPIRKIKESRWTEYYVDIRGVDQPKFLTIDGLVKFYLNFSSGHCFKDSDGFCMDVFPLPFC